MQIYTTVVAQLLHAIAYRHQRCPLILRAVNYLSSHFKVISCSLV